MHFLSIILSISLAATALLTAQEQPLPIYIDALVSQTLALNPELKFYAGEILAARAGSRKAGKLPNPELTLDAGHKRVSSGNAAVEGFAFSASLAQPIEWPGRLGLRKAIANRDIGLAELGLERFKNHLTARVRLLAYSLAAQQEIAAAASDVADRYTGLRDVLVQRDPAGIAPLLESRTIEAATIVAQARAGSAQVEMQKALLELNQLMGRRADTQLTVARPEFTFSEMPELNTLFTQAARNHYELQIRLAELEQQGFKVALAESERYPTFVVGPFVSHEKAGDKETVAGISLSVPLPLWENGRANVDTENARQFQAQATLTAAQREVERQVAEAAMLFKSQRAQLTAWKPEALTTFRDAATLADRHYRLGAVPIATYIELQDKYLEATEAINQAKAAALDAALTLEALTGTSGSLVKSPTKN